MSSPKRPPGNFTDEAAALCQKYRVAAIGHLPLEAKPELDELYRVEALRRAYMISIRNPKTHSGFAKAKAVQKAKSEKLRAEAWRMIGNLGGLEVAPTRMLARQLGIAVSTVSRMLKEFRSERDAKRRRCSECGQLRHEQLGDEPEAKP
jgi:hypothetical protein